MTYSQASREADYQALMRAGWTAPEKSTWIGFDTDGDIIAAMADHWVALFDDGWSRCATPVVDEERIGLIGCWA